MKKLKVIISLVLIIALLTSVSVGCGSSKADFKNVNLEPASTTVTEKPIEITWWEYPNYSGQGTQIEGEYERQYLADFQKKYPNVKVNMEMIAFNTGPEKINVAIATNTKPDLIYDYPGRILDYARQGQLVPLDDIMPDSVKNDIPSALISFCSLNGKTYMYPASTTPFLMGFNKTLFEQIGALDLLPLNRPDRYWTVDEYEKALRAVKERAVGIAPAVIYCKNQIGDPSMRFLIANLYGADIISEDHKKILINSENGVKGLQWVVDRYKEGLFAQGAETFLSNDAIDMYLQGKAASSIIYSPVLKSIYSNKKTAEFEEVFLPWPTQPGQKPKIEVSVFGFSIFDNRDADKANECKKLIDFIVNDSNWGPKNLKATGGLSPRISVSNTDSDKEIQYAASIVKYAADTGFTVPNYSEMRSRWFPMLQKVLIGKTTPKEGLDKFAKEATEIINKK